MPLTLAPLAAFLLAERRKPPGISVAIFFSKPDGSRRSASK
jgi:hypothetical protein